jgi:hypothetical protein
MALPSIGCALRAHTAVSRAVPARFFSREILFVISELGAASVDPIEVLHVEHVM